MAVHSEVNESCKCSRHIELSQVTYYYVKPGGNMGAAKLSLYYADNGWCENLIDFLPLYVKKLLCLSHL